MPWLICCRNGFQKLDKIKDANRRSRQLEELTDKMRDCKRLFLTSFPSVKRKCLKLISMNATFGKSAYLAPVWLMSAIYLPQQLLHYLILPCILPAMHALGILGMALTSSL